LPVHLGPTSAAPLPGSQAAKAQAEALLNETRSLERQLRLLIRSSAAASATQQQQFINTAAGVTSIQQQQAQHQALMHVQSCEKQVFALRKTMRHHYRQVIYLSPQVAAQHEVEINLWKRVFYRSAKTCFSHD
jgi:hypothetical protein